MNEIFAFDRSVPDNTTFDPDLRLPLLEDVLALCSGLVTVSERGNTGQPNADLESLEVRLAHNSVKDYLVSHHFKNGPSMRFALEAGPTHSILANVALYILYNFMLG